jgi:hypothetical protein
MSVSQSFLSSVVSAISCLYLIHCCHLLCLPSPVCISVIIVICCTCFTLLLVSYLFLPCRVRIFGIVLCHSCHHFVVLVLFCLSLYNIFVCSVRTFSLSSALNLSWIILYILVSILCSGDVMFGCVDSWLLYKLTGNHMTEVGYPRYIRVQLESHYDSA